MLKTFTNLPPAFETAISAVLAEHDATEWIKRAEVLHTRYMERQNDTAYGYLHDFSDVLAYLTLRIPATYAQIYSALNALQEIIPSWQPKTVLDIGSGPGTGVWAAQSIWPTVHHATCLDQNTDMISLGQHIISASKVPVTVSCKQSVLPQGIESIDSQYDLVIIANVLNELASVEREKILQYAYNICNGVMIVVEPGIPFGSTITQSVAKNFVHNDYLLAPYIASSFVEKKDHWLHFSQRFIRPEFERRVRQHMRESSLMASDWEEAKYSYVAIGKIPPENNFWGRCIGPIKKQKGFVEAPILTEKEIMWLKVLQRHKKEYAFAKRLRWGQVITSNGQNL